MIEAGPDQDFEDLDNYSTGLKKNQGYPELNTKNKINEAPLFIETIDKVKEIINSRSCVDSKGSDHNGESPFKLDKHYSQTPSAGQIFSKRLSSEAFDNNQLNIDLLMNLK